jgi:hypothetical protein
MRKKIKFDYQQVERLAASGLTFEEMASSLGVSRDTLNERRRDTPEFDAAVRRGKAGLKSEIANLLVERARKGDVVAQIWIEKTRFGYRENMPPEPGPQIDKDTAVALLLERVERIAKARREGAVAPPVESAPEGTAPAHPALYQQTQPVAPADAAGFIADNIENSSAMYKVLSARLDLLNQEIGRMVRDPKYRSHIRGNLETERSAINSVLRSLRSLANDYGVDSL